MENSKIGTLSKNFLVDDKYKIILFIKGNISAETYRVKGTDGKLYFLKLFNYLKLNRSSFDSNNDILEIEVLRQITSPNIVSYKDSGEQVFDGKRYGYLVLNFIAGETLKEKIVRDGISSLYDIKQIATDVLKGLNYLHNLPMCIVHNDITLDNIMLDLSNDIPQAKIIDFGHALSFHQSSKAFNKDGLNPYYTATECFNNLYSPQSDVFSLGAVLYHLLFGMPPWNKDISIYQANRVKQEEIIITERNKPLKFPNRLGNIIDFDESIISVIMKALEQDPGKRYQNTTEFMSALNGNFTHKEKIEDPIIDNIIRDKNTKIIKGKGFNAIAGMKYLKEQLQYDVINVIENPEEYKKHNLGLPNGMLLYGPPGCGKTFFAERFAEEAGYNFIKVVSSDIASIYVHGSQEKIGKLFTDAREKAPTILYFDELDAMVPNRENVNNQSQSGEVNEFLSQLDNIGDSGVFVIGSTNKPDAIDKAVLRAGRLEKWYYISPPDFEARKALFELYLKSRPLDFGIDYNRLATLTENYVSSDIKLLIDEASRKTIRDKIKRVSMQTLENTIKNQKPTVSRSELKKYESIRKKIEQDIEDSQDSRTRIGFNLTNSKRDE